MEFNLKFTIQLNSLIFCKYSIYIYIYIYVVIYYFSIFYNIFLHLYEKDNNLYIKNNNNNNFIATTVNNCPTQNTYLSNIVNVLI